MCARIFGVGLVCCSCFVVEAATASPRMGVAELHADGTACITLAGTPIRSGEHFWIVLFDPPRIVDGTISGRKTEVCRVGLEDAGQAYGARMRFDFGTEGELGIAVFAAGSRAEFVEGEFVFHTPEAKTPLSFRRCASQEGLHVTAWRGNRRTWHEYVYLGMDLEADCSDEEVRE